MILDTNNYFDRVKSANDFDERNESETKFYGYDPNLNKIKGSLFSYESLHRFGIIHTTADIFLLLTNNKIIIQKRAKSIDIPDIYGPSAGGHCEYDQLPKDTALIELNEELGLRIDSERIKPIFKNGQPINNYFFRKFISSEQRNIVLQRFAPNSQWYTDKGIPAKNIIENPKSFYFNQELAYFFYVLIDYDEKKEILINKDEISSIETFNISSFRGLVKKQMYFSDSLYLMNEYKFCDLIQK